jgi:(4-alkanoyl-5-oxo-2,5-dihydrofuran-3-yl)methyl phosphate reductase
MILVTGATGTIGRPLVDRLVAAGVPVRATSRQPDGADLPAGVDVVHADLGQPDSLTAAFAGVARVFLLSTGSNIPEHDANVGRAAVRAGVGGIVKLSGGRAGDATATDPVCSLSPHHSIVVEARESALRVAGERDVDFVYRTEKVPSAAN